MLKWHGKQYEEKLNRAIPWAINKTMADCVKTAKDNHPWKNRTGTTEGSIQMRVAELVNGIWVGVWGYFNILWGRFLEHGTSKMMPYPTLRPSADKNYPHLIKYIKEAMASK